MELVNSSNNIVRGYACALKCNVKTNSVDTDKAVRSFIGPPLPSPSYKAKHLTTYFNLAFNSTRKLERPFKSCNESFRFLLFLLYAQ